MSMFMKWKKTELVTLFIIIAFINCILWIVFLSRRIYIFRLNEFQWIPTTTDNNAADK